MLKINLRLFCWTSLSQFDEMGRDVKMFYLQKKKRTNKMIMQKYLLVNTHCVILKFLLIMMMNCIVVFFLSVFSIAFAVDPCRFEYSGKGVIDLTSVGHSDGTAAFVNQTTPSSPYYSTWILFQYVEIFQDNNCFIL